jgi:hypothetical protein
VGGIAGWNGLAEDLLDEPSEKGNLQNKCGI